MKNKIVIQRLVNERIPEALAIAWKVFLEYESPDYSTEGTEEFNKCLHDESYLSGIEYYGAFDGETLIGTIGIRAEKRHICFFFVDGNYHRQGIGTALFKCLLKDHRGETITLNSSPYGVPFYKAIGFVPTDKEQTVNGIRFTPMKYEGKLTTERLILRHWEESDAESLYEYAKDPDVGPIAGWQPHGSVEESRNIIKNVLSGPEAYAVCLKEDNKAVGAIELMLGGSSVNSIKSDDECELGFWIGKPFWGQGLIPEAAKEMLRRAFEDLNMNKVWCGYYHGNEKSKRVQEKVGFCYQYTKDDVFVPALNETRTERMSCITRKKWKEYMNNE
jgi:RimJ/RimL family protein N-acetyltransferase